MHDLAWPLAVVVLGLVALGGFRKSISGLLRGAKLRKVPGGFEFDQPPQQQIEGANEEPKPAIAKAIENKTTIDDPVFGPKLKAIRADLNKLQDDRTTRENALVTALA
jgi:hypothetical protein